MPRMKIRNKENTNWIDIADLHEHYQYASRDGYGTRAAYAAMRLYRELIAGDGLLGGGLLTEDTTLSIDFTRQNTWTGTQNYTSEINAQGGINVGTATGASGGNIVGSGTIQMSGTGNNYLLGNLGIGNDNPSEKLDILGDQKLSGSLKVHNNAPSYFTGQLIVGSTNTSSNAKVFVLGDLSVDGNITATNFSGIAISDAPGVHVRIDGALAVTPDVGSYVCPGSGEIIAVYIYCKNTGTSGNTIVDCNKNGTTIFTNQNNRPTLSYNDTDKIAKSGTPNIINFSENDVISFDIDSVANGASDLEIILAIKLNVPGGGGGGGHIIQNNGTNMPTRSKLNFVGFRMQDNQANDATVVMGANPPWLGNILEPPKLSDFSWINQGGAVSTEYDWGVSIYAPTNNSASLRILAKSLNYTSNYRVTIGYYFIFPNITANYAGLLLLDDSNKLVHFGTRQSNLLNLSKWNSPQSHLSAYLEFGYNHSYPFFVRFVDDGTTRQAFYSTDGINFCLFYTISRTDHITPTKVGFGISVSSTTLPGYISVIHFKEEPL